MRFLTLAVTFLLAFSILATQAEVDLHGKTHVNDQALPPTVQNLIKHLEQHPTDVVIPKGMVEYKMNHYGGVALIANVDIPDNTTIFKISILNPKTTITVRHDERFIKLAEALDVGDSVACAVLLYWERVRCDNHGTLNKVYADDLITRFTEFTTTPFYTQSELAEFQGGHTSLGPIKTRKTMEKALEKLKTSNILQTLPFGEGCKATWDPIFEPDYLLKLYTMVSSRTFGILVRDRNISDIYCVPVIDLVNTEADPNCHVEIVGDADEFAIVSQKPIKKGAEITIEYPTLGNYIYHYGFCMDNNTHSPYKFPIFTHLETMVSELTNPRERSEYLNELNENRHLYSSLKLARSHGTRELDQYVINFIKALHSQDRLDALNRIDRIHEEFNFRDEKSMFHGLKRLFKMLAKKYKTSIEEDQTLIAKGIQNIKVYCAVIIRRDEKMVIKKILDQLDAEEKNVNQFVSKVARSKLPGFLKPMRMFGKDKNYFLWKKITFLHERATLARNDQFLLVRWYANQTFPTFKDVQEKIPGVESVKDNFLQGNLLQYTFKIPMQDYTGDFAISDLKTNGEHYWYVALNKKK